MQWRGKNIKKRLIKAKEEWIDKNGSKDQDEDMNANNSRLVFDA